VTRADGGEPGILSCVALAHGHSLSCCCCSYRFPRMCALLQHMLCNATRIVCMLLNLPTVQPGIMQGAG
jgi:hypothetical protein